MLLRTYRESVKSYLRIIISNRLRETWEKMLNEKEVQHRSYLLFQVRVLCVVFSTNRQFRENDKNSYFPTDPWNLSASFSKSANPRKHMILQTTVSLAEKVTPLQEEILWGNDGDLYLALACKPHSAQYKSKSKSGPGSVRFTASTRNPCRMTLAHVIIPTEMCTLQPVAAIRRNSQGYMVLWIICCYLFKVLYTMRSNFEWWTNCLV